MKETVNRYAVITAYFLIYVVWGSTYYFIGVALQGIPPFLLGALRFTVAGIILLAACRFRGERVFDLRLIRRSAVSGIVLLFVDMAVIMLAQRYVSSSLVAIVASSTAVWIMLLDAPMWRHNFRNLPAVGGVLLGFAGVTMLYVEQLREGEALQRHGEYGILLLIVGCVSWALGTLYTKYRSSEVENVYAFSGAAWQMVFASLAFWMCACVTGEWVETDWRAVSVWSWSALAYLVTCGSILVVSVFLRFLSLATFCKPTICKILFRETNPGRDKNGTKPQENKIKNASSPASLVMDFSFLCKGTILSREKQAISYKYVVNQPFISHGHFQEDTANASHTDLCCLFQRSVKICFMSFVHYGISAVAHCLGQMYNPPAIISNAECVSNQ